MRGRRALGCARRLGEVEQIAFVGTRITRVRGLGRLTSLQMLVLCGTHMESLDGLAWAGRLEFLAPVNSQLRSIGGSREAGHIGSLLLSDARIHDYQPIRALSDLWIPFPQALFRSGRGVFGRVTESFFSQPPASQGGRPFLGGRMRKARTIGSELGEVPRLHLPCSTAAITRSGFVGHRLYGRRRPRKPRRARVTGPSTGSG